MTRIIAGRAGGRRIAAPKGDRTRPTTDRTKEALFSALVSWLGVDGADPDAQFAGCAVLDLFSGSGAIALEAASRGAERAVAVESDRATATLIGRTASSLGLDVAVVPLKAATYLAGAPTPFDLVFADPPYGVATAEVDALIAALASGWLVEDALVVIERARRDDAPTWTPEFTDAWARRYGETTLYFATVRPMEET